VLNLLGDIFLRSQNVTDKEFISKLEQGGIAYTVHRIENGSYVEVGRFCHRFNEQGQSRGGWIRDCAEDRGGGVGGAVDRAYLVGVDDLRDICDALNDGKREYQAHLRRRRPHGLSARLHA
jgi:hypothetical protein